MSEDKLHLDLLTEYVGDAYVIKCQWTPALCLIESRRNKEKSDGNNIRNIVTYEGPIGCSV